MPHRYAYFAKGFMTVRVFKASMSTTCSILSQHIRCYLPSYIYVDVELFPVGSFGRPLDLDQSDLLDQCWLNQPDHSHYDNNKSLKYKKKSCWK